MDELRAAVALLPEGTSVMFPREALLTALNADSTVSVPAETPAVEPERWLTAKEVAACLQTSSRYIYAHRRSFPFTKELPGGAIRFSERGLRRWMERAK